VLILPVFPPANWSGWNLETGITVYSNCLPVKGISERQDGVLNIMGEQFTPLHSGTIEDSITVREVRHGNTIRMLLNA